MAGRRELEQAVERGETVHVLGHVQPFHKDDDWAGTLPRDAHPDRPIQGVVTRDREGRLTRAGMELALQQGGGVMLPGGKIVTEQGRLPTEADLARGNEERARQVREALLGQMAALQAELVKVSSGSSPGGGQAEGVGATPGAAPPGGPGELERLRRENEELRRKAADADKLAQQRQAIHHAEDVQEGAAPAPPLFGQRDEPKQQKGKGK